MKKICTFVCGLVFSFTFVLCAAQQIDGNKLKLERDKSVQEKLKKYKIENPKKKIQFLNVEDPYVWGSFQDAEIVTGLGRDHNQVHLLFAVRKGHKKDERYSQDPNIGLWLAYQDNGTNWHSQGVIAELSDSLNNDFNFRPATVANKTADVLTVCADYAKYQHIFIKTMKISPQGLENRLLYVKRTPQGQIKVKMSQLLADDMGYTMRCVADNTNTIHIFGLHNWATESYSKLVHYKLDWNEQEKQDKFFTMVRTELPAEFETHEFTAWNSGTSVDLLYNYQNFVTLSLARHQFEGGQLRSVASSWNILNNNNATPESNTHMLRDRHGFSYGRHKRAHIIGRLKRLEADGSVENGIGYYFQDNNGTWKSNGLVLNRELASLSVTGLETRPIFYMIGVTPDAKVWYGYYHNQQQKWIDGGIIFNTDVK